MSAVDDTQQKRSATIAVIGSGTVGRSWAACFVRGGHHVRIYDVDADHAVTTIAWVRDALRTSGLSDTEVDSCAARVHVVPTLEAAVNDAIWVQENVPEDTLIKSQIFQALDKAANRQAILASSTSAIPASQFVSSIAGRNRCLVAHPINPPHLIPLVEVLATHWTDERVLARALKFLRDLGQEPVLIRREIQGFVSNRLQAALINEAMSLIGKGIISPADLDLCVSRGLGLRWAFLGPLETMDLNAADGFEGYARRFKNSYFELGKDLNVDRRWTKSATDQIAQWRRSILPAREIGKRQIWRDHLIVKLRRLIDSSTR
jgi:L-gulonate 3-dehydrogenase